MNETSKTIPPAEAMPVKTAIVRVVMLLLLVVGPSFGPIPAYLAATLDLRTAVAAQLGVFVAVYGVVLVATINVMRKCGITGSDIGWRQPSRAGAIVAAVVLGLVWAGLGAMGYLQLEPNANLLELSSYRVAISLVAAAAVVLEDWITRGFIMEAMRRTGFSTWMQILGSSTLFAVYHSVWALSIAGFLASFVYGLLLAGLFVFGRRSLTPVIVAHSLTLLLGEPFLTMAMLVSL